MHVLLGATKKIETVVEQWISSIEKGSERNLPLSNIKKKDTKEGFESLSDVRKGVENLFPLLKQKCKIFYLISDQE